MFHEIGPGLACAAAGERELRTAQNSGSTSTTLSSLKRLCWHVNQHHIVCKVWELSRELTLLSQSRGLGVHLRSKAFSWSFTCSEGDPLAFLAAELVSLTPRSTGALPIRSKTTRTHIPAGLVLFLTTLDLQRAR